MPTPRPVRPELVQDPVLIRPKEPVLSLPKDPALSLTPPCILSLSKNVSSPGDATRRLLSPRPADKHTLTPSTHTPEIPARPRGAALSNPRPTALRRSPVMPVTDRPRIVSATGAQSCLGAHRSQPESAPPRAKSFLEKTLTRANPPHSTQRPAVPRVSLAAPATLPASGAGLDRSALAETCS